MAAMTKAKPALASDGTPHPSPIPDLESVQAAQRAHHGSCATRCGMRCQEGGGTRGYSHKRV
jgi:hypothetical protein